MKLVNTLAWKYTFIIVILLFLFSSSGYAKERSDSSATPVLSLYMRPLSLKADYASAQFGVDCRIANNIRFGLVLGYGTSDFLKNPKSYVSDYSLFEFHPQVQIFVMHRNSHVKIALGAEFVYRDIKSYYGPAQYSPRNGVILKFDQATYTEKIRAVHFLSSVIILPETHIVIEAYFGLGFGSRMIDFTDVVNERSSSGSGGGSWLSFPSLGGPPKKNIGEQGGLSATIGIKLGYRF